MTRKWSDIKREKIPPGERIAFAQYSGTRARLRDELRVGEERLNELFDAWEIEAVERGLDRHDRGYWDQAWPWLLEHGRR